MDEQDQNFEYHRLDFIPNSVNSVWFIATIILFEISLAITIFSVACNNLKYSCVDTAKIYGPPLKTYLICEGANRFFKCLIILLENRALFSGKHFIFILRLLCKFNADFMRKNIFIVSLFFDITFFYLGLRVIFINNSQCINENDSFVIFTLFVWLFSIVDTIFFWTNKCIQIPNIDSI